MTRDGREIVFIWVPGHVGIRGNSAADSAAKDALDGDVSVELIPFSDLKSRTSQYILELWQSEWDEFPENKWDISNTKRMYCLSPDKQKRRDWWPDCILAILLLLIPFYWKVRNRQCVSDVVNV